MADDEEAAQEFVPKHKKVLTEEEKRREKISPGSLLKAAVRPGVGTLKPEDGNQVIFHCTILTLDGVVVQSTKTEHGGNGIPMKYVLGKSKMLLGLLESIPTMLKGEVAMFKMKPELHYGEVDCPVVVSETFPKNDILHFEIEMIDFFKVMVLCEDLGVLKKVVKEGEGWETPREPYEVKAWITANTCDGKVVLPRTSEPFFFTFGKNEVPKGLEMGIGSMTRGEKATIFVTSAYLSQSPLISVGSAVEEIQFDVELIHFIQVRDMLGDGRLVKRRIVDGKGEFPMDCPLHDSLLCVHYKGTLLDEGKTVFYDTRIDNGGQPLEFSSGEGLVPEGFEMCVRLMLPGEKALVKCPPDYAYDKFPRPENVPEGAHVQWEIELLSFEAPQDWTGMSFHCIMDDAERIKNIGNRLFKERKYELAKTKYEKVLRDYNHVNPQNDEEGKIFLNSRNSFHLNVAACYQKLGEYRKSIETCNKVLDVSPAHVKALYRRGVAYMSVGDFDEAKSDFNMMMDVDKLSSADATAALTKLRQKEQQANKAAQKQFKGIFDKKPGEISEVGDDKNKCQAKEEYAEAMLGRSEQAHKVGLVGRLCSMVQHLFSLHGLSRCSLL